MVGTKDGSLVVVHASESDGSSSEDDVGAGPAPPPGMDVEGGQVVGGEKAEGERVVRRKRKRRRVMVNEKVYMDLLPCADMYQKSYMHRDVVTNVVLTPRTDFFVTGSADGQLKFWKKVAGGIEFVKQFRAHLGHFSGMSTSADGLWLGTTSEVDKTMKVFDVIGFDMVNFVKLDFVPGPCEWVHATSSAAAVLAVADKNKPVIYLFRSNEATPFRTITTLPHRAPIQLMRFNAVHSTVVSIDAKRMVEYWTMDGDEPSSLPESVKFKFKMDTDLYDFAKNKTDASSLEFSKDGSLFACLARDRQVRVFRFETGKLVRKYDESLQRINELQDNEVKLDPGDFGRRMARERAFEEALDSEEAPTVAKPSCVFDESGNFLLYATVLGIKVLNIVTNRLVRWLGVAESSERFLALALYQGNPQKTATIMNGGEQARDEADPTLIATSFGKQRLFLFTRTEPKDEGGDTGRDVLNERPLRTGADGRKDRRRGTNATDASLQNTDDNRPLDAEGTAIADSVVLHTTAGDIHAKLFPVECPKTVENFTTHAKNGYYNNVLFHRVIKDFMLQTGDPQGDGTGGTSIWGREFEDEIHRHLKHDRPGVLSMANAGPNTNGSQFFLTAVPTPWLDGKHTVFGRVTKGLDTIATIEKAKTDKRDKPLQDIRIISISVGD